MINLTNILDPCSFLMSELINFHDETLYILLFITSIVIYFMFSIFLSKLINRFLLFNESVEIMWTIFPGIVLLFIAFPSLKVLYLSDDLINPDMTLKVLGHQWFWSYEYSDFINIEFDSYMKLWDKSNYRLLDVDNRVIIPINHSIRVLVSSLDVIHSWTVPSLGVKTDANPGRLNQVFISANQLGLFYGQCSEICGTLHSFMPICLEITKPKDFINWLMLWN
uniref:Cytochrome c oxidase subunit 2 n=1 Tax=Ricinus sp. ADS-2020 TaxID=2794903 RepID=A0A7T1M879_9NEOP|nr:cytochrome c oxidase subunit 2 [Ricinus sp. ADS-2020]